MTAGQFPGSLRIPGTDAALKIGSIGVASTSTASTPWARTTKFVTYIPVAGSEEAGKGDHAAFGPAQPLQLRSAHAHGRGRDARVHRGQLRSWATPSGFATPTAGGEGCCSVRPGRPSPTPRPQDGIDFEGLNAISLFRQAQTRSRVLDQQGAELALAAENPAPDISAADGSPVQGVNQVPDVVVRLRWTPGERTSSAPHARRHPHARRQPRAGGAAFRPPGPGRPTMPRCRRVISYRFQQADSSPWRGERDRILFANAAGWGIGRYITDLGTLGRRMPSTIPRPTRSGPLPSFRRTSATSIGGARRFGPPPPGERSSSDNLKIQAGDAFNRTDRATLNLSWSPIPRIDLVSELLWGRRTNKDGEHGEARQVQLGANFRF